MDTVTLFYNRRKPLDVRSAIVKACNELNISSNFLFDGEYFGRIQLTLNISEQFVPFVQSIANQYKVVYGDNYNVDFHVESHNIAVRQRIK